MCLFERDFSKIVITYNIRWLIHAGTRKIHVDVETKDGDSAWGVHGDAHAGWALAYMEEDNNTDEDDDNAGIKRPFTQFDRVTITVTCYDEEAAECIREGITQATGVEVV